MPDIFRIENEHFQGPLEALLGLIEARKLSISLVSLSEVCDAYLAYVEKLPELPLSETSQFVLVASTLLLIKSRTLLPSVELSDEETRSIEELEKRLAHYAVIRKAAKALRGEWGEAPLHFPKRQPSPEYVGGVKLAFDPGETTLEAIHNAILRLVSLLPKPERMAEATVAPVLALEDAVKGLKNRLTSAIRMRWSEIARGTSRDDRIVHFLAILELVRNGSVSATQDRLFNDILLETEMVGVPRY
jgi:segregation and condensation protein A